MIIKFRYTNSHKEVADYILETEYNLQSIYKLDCKLLEMAIVDTGSPEEERAVEELLGAFKKHLQGIVKPSPYTLLDNGLKKHNVTGKLYRTGIIISKEVIITGNYKPVKSTQKTILKNKWRKKLLSSKNRMFNTSKMEVYND